MPSPYSLDLRTRIIKAYESGDVTHEEISERYDLGVATVKRYWRQYQQKGHVLPREWRRGPRPYIDSEGLIEVKRLVETYPDVTLDELCDYYNEFNKCHVGRSIMFRAMEKLGVRRKKKSLYATEQERPDIKKP